MFVRIYSYFVNMVELYRILQRTNYIVGYNKSPPRGEKAQIYIECNNFLPSIEEMEILYKKAFAMASNTLVPKTL